MADLSLNYSEKLLGQEGYGDLLLTNGDLTLTNDVDPAGTDPTIQNVTQRLKLFLGEAFMRLDAGVPWYQQILVKNADPAAVDGILRDTILGTPGVVALTSYVSQQDRAARRYTVRFSILTATGKRIASTVPIAVGGGN